MSDVTYKTGKPDYFKSLDDGLKKPDKKSKNGYSHGMPFALPKDRTVVDVVQEGIQYQRGGYSPEQAARAVGLSPGTYIRLRDITMLAERDDLTEKDVATVKAALAEIEKTHRVLKPWSTVAPIISRVWGTRGQRLKAGDRKRIEQFEKAIAYIYGTCEAAGDIEIPYINAAKADDAYEKIYEAEKALRKLRGRISSETTDAQHARREDPV